MDGKATIAHEGLVVSLGNNLVRVRFVAHSACAACSARGICSVSESEEKFVDVAGSGLELNPGDRVEILLEQTQGFKALFYGYILPLLVLLAVLTGVFLITNREGISALAGLGAMIPYYLIIWLFRKKISKSFHFRLRKQEI
jgi:sigma-E factor negative regulatory protein RseC